MKTNCIPQEKLDNIFPATKADEFFEAIYGGAEDGAYDIVLTCEDITASQAAFAFELRRRPGQCLKCSLTYGLPEVFKRHPLLNIAGVAGQIANELGWGANYQWELQPVREISDDLHVIPFIIEKA